MNTPLTHKTVKGDTLAQMALDFYDDGRAADALRAINKIAEPVDAELPHKKTVNLPSHVVYASDGVGTRMISFTAAMLNEAVTELSWGKKACVAWDSSDREIMKIGVSAQTAMVVDETPATLEVFQFGPGENHVLIDTVEGLKIIGGELRDAKGKEVVYTFKWHDSIYDYKRTQYFVKLKAGEASRTMSQKVETMVRLQHHDGIVADPDDTLSGALKEGKWVRNYLSKSGVWIEAVNDKAKQDGHHVTGHFSKSANVTRAVFTALIEQNKFLHHQASHGTAYCVHGGVKKFVKKTRTKGADGNREYLCPQCNTKNNAVGCLCLVDNANYFYTNHVQAAKRAPRAVVLANCCLTAITDAYPRVWIDKGTRWYIGWALPVGDLSAVRFAKKFYKRWQRKYKGDPDKVKAAFNDVKGSFSRYRPRIFGA